MTATIANRIRRDRSDRSKSSHAGVPRLITGTLSIVLPAPVSILPPRGRHSIRCTQSANVTVMHTRRMRCSSTTSGERWPHTLSFAAPTVAHVRSIRSACQPLLTLSSQRRALQRSASQRLCSKLISLVFQIQTHGAHFRSAAPSRPVAQLFGQVLTNMSTLAASFCVAAIASRAVVLPLWDSAVFPNAPLVIGASACMLCSGTSQQRLQCCGCL
jgi:hypothetical protein